MAKSRIPEKLDFLLHGQFTAGNLQGGIYINKATKVLRDKTLSGQSRYVIKMVPTKVKGTGIPAPTLQKFMSGNWKPRKKSIDKLLKFYKRVSYHRLNASGANSQESKRHCNAAPSEISELSERYLSLIRKSAREKKIPFIAMLFGASLSELNDDDWDTYVNTRN